MKKLFFFLLLTSLCFMCAFSEEEIFSNGYYQYRVLEDGTAEITQYTGNEKRVVVPDTLDGYKVTVIGDDSFMHLSSAESIILPEGIRRIGDSAFYQCYVKNLTIPDGVTEIGKDAFAFVKRVEFNLPDSITRIEESAFRDCDFTEIRLPSNLTYIGDGAFFNNKQLRRISIPTGVTAIHQNTFAKCDSLTTVILPNTVRAIQFSAFGQCLYLERVYIPESVTLIDSLALYDSNPDVTIVCAKGSKAEEFARKQGFNIEYPTTEEEEMRNFSYSVKADGTLSITGYVGKKIDITVPSSIDGAAVTSVSPASFAGVSNLKSVTLPDTLTEIGEYAFIGCKALEVLAIDESVSEIGTAVAAYCPNLTLKVTENSEAHRYALENGMKFELLVSDVPDYSDFVTAVNEDGSLSIVRYLGEETTVVFPSVISGSPVTGLSRECVPSLVSLVSVTLPEGLVSIGDFCFLGSHALETLVIPESVTEIGNGVGMYCPNLECVVKENSYAHEYVVSAGIPFVFSEN